MLLYQKLLKYKVVPVLYFLALIVILAVGIRWFIHSGLVPLLADPAALEAYFENLGARGYLVVFLLQMFGVVFLPATGGVIVAASAVLFGFLKTFLICSAATIAGSCISFALARYLGRPLIDLFLDKHKVDKYIHSFEERKNLLLLLMFFFPFFPDDILCYVAGLVNIRWRFFLLAAAIGRPWGLVISCLIGMSVFSLPVWAYLPLGALVIAAFLYSWKKGPQWEKRIIAKVNRRNEKKAALSAVSPKEPKAKENRTCTAAADIGKGLFFNGRPGTDEAS
ncbi:MAG TPA: TVP38/TMEM64 family protein [Bacillales bacterium]|nr:TVP38/TMEM64 family protein [Bacillales bacterium]